MKQEVHGIAVQSKIASGDSREGPIEKIAVTFLSDPPLTVVTLWLTKQ
jgi:hypothetical protein